MLRKFIRRGLILLVVLAVIAGLFMVTVSSYVMHSASPDIAASMTSKKDGVTAKELKRLKKLDAQCIMVLGCGIIGTEKPTPMLKDRLDTALRLYWAGVSPKLLLSGDNGTVSHNEIHVMLKYVRKAGVPESDIFCDHAGFSTYDSAVRARQIFRVKRMILVTQNYHMYRAVYDTKSTGIRVLGVSADQQRYGGQSARDVREILARVKDWYYVKKGQPAQLGGSPIPITGSGIVSHGE